jgi:hypothetical protein
VTLGDDLWLNQRCHATISPGAHIQGHFQGAGMARARQQDSSPPVEAQLTEAAANGKASTTTDVPVTEQHWSERPIGRVEVPPVGEFSTPVRVDEIAVAAMALSENLDAATR